MKRRIVLLLLASLFVLGCVSSAFAATGFIDVSKRAWYYKPVMWAADQGITNGVDKTHFEPNGPCTRAQFVTFLWRDANCPKIDQKEFDVIMEHAYDDAKNKSAYYAMAMAWATKVGIVHGSSDENGRPVFCPNACITRAEAATMLWRALDGPCLASNGCDIDYKDVPADSYYSYAVRWLTNCKVVNGTGKGMFSPNKFCTRAEMATMLYRAAEEQHLGGKASDGFIPFARGN